MQIGITLSFSLLFRNCSDRGEQDVAREARIMHSFAAIVSEHQVIPEGTYSGIRKSRLLTTLRIINGKCIHEKLSEERRNVDTRYTADEDPERKGSK
jgi:hypothetical protein